MKKVFIFAIVAIGILFNYQISFAQKISSAELPAQVAESFRKHFPEVKNAEWEKEGTNFEAEYKVSKINMDNPKAKKLEIEKSAVFNAAGDLIQTEEEINVADLPKSIIEYANKNYPGKKINEAAKITEITGEVKYEAEIGKDDYLFDAHGKFLSKESDKKDDDKKD